MMQGGRDSSLSNQTNPEGNYHFLLVVIVSNVFDYISMALITFQIYGFGFPTGIESKRDGTHSSFRVEFKQNNTVKCSARQLKLPSNAQIFKKRQYLFPFTESCPFKTNIVSSQGHCECVLR